MLKKSVLATAVTSLFIFATPGASIAQSAEARGQAEVSVKSHKDQITARATARRAAEYEAVRAALRLRLNMDLANPKVESAIPDMTVALADNLKTTFATEGDILTARTLLSVDSAQLTDLARSLGLQNMNAMEAASIVFLVDEYWGIATNLDPSQPLVSEVEYFHDKSSASDTSSKSSGSSYSDTSAKSASASTYSASMAASSKESGAISASQSASASGQRSAFVAGSDNTAVAARDGYGNAAAGSRSTQAAGSSKESFAGSASKSASASYSSDTRVAASETSSNAQSSDVKNVRSKSHSSVQKNVQTQKDVVSIKTRVAFPDTGNAKPSDQQASLIPQRLTQITSQYGLRYTPERDLRETGKGRMLISDIEQQRRFDEYTTKVGKNPYNAKYVVYGTSVMSAEGKSASGQTLCSGMLKLDSFNVDTGRGLVAGTLNKRAQGTSDQDCRSNLSTALATELAQTVGNAATREIQLAATLGQSYTVTLYSTTNINRRTGGAFEDSLRSMIGGEVREEKRTDATRIYMVAAKGGDFVRRVERVLDSLGDSMNNAEVQSRGNRVVVCIEGKCPSDY